MAIRVIHMILLAAGIVLVGLLALAYVVGGALRDLSGSISDREPPESQPVDEERLHTIERGLNELAQAVAEGIERVGRSERRIKDTVRRARERLAESGLADPALEAEAGDLQAVDAGGSEAEGVPGMHEDVGDGGAREDAWRVVPGRIA